MDKWLSLLVASLALLGCATPQQAAHRAAVEAHRQRLEAAPAPPPAELAATVAAQRRLAMVSDAVALKDAELCGPNVVPRTGLRIWNTEGMRPQLAEAMRSACGIGDHITIFSVARGTPAEAGGLEPGDRLLAIGRWTIPEGKGARKAFDERLGQELRDAAPIAIAFDRGGSRRETTALPSIAASCAGRCIECGINGGLTTNFRDMKR